MNQTVKATHEELMRYKNSLVKDTPDFWCYGTAAKCTEKMTDGEKMKYLAAELLYRAELATEGACKFAAENNLRWVSNELLQASHYYDSYQMILTILSGDWRGAAEIEENLHLTSARQALKVLEEEKGKIN